MPIAILGVAADVSDGDVKKAYRKQMSQHHPDKLAAKGLPPEMMNMAKRKGAGNSAGVGVD